VSRLFPHERRARAPGLVAGANAGAWIVVSPLAGALTAELGWRVAEAVPAAIALAALLTFNGAFFIEVLGLHETGAGMLLAVRPAAYLVASTGGVALVHLASQRVVVAASAGRWGSRSRRCSRVPSG
jgi:hypothetical protein